MEPASIATLFPPDQFQSFLSSLENQLMPAEGIYSGEVPFLAAPASASHLGSPTADDSDSMISNNSDSGGSTFPCVPSADEGTSTDANKFMGPQRRMQRQERQSSLQAKKDVTKTSVPSHNIEELLEEAELKRKRLARKAELARVSRKRKKMRIEELEDEVANLKAQLEREKKRTRDAQENSHGPPAPVSSAAVADQRLVQALQVVLNGEPSEGVEKFQSAFLDKVQSQIFQADDIVKSLQPALPVQFMQWVLSQKDSFYEDENGLWSSLFGQEVKADVEQIKRLKALRAEINLSRSSTCELEAAAANLKTLLGHQTSQSAKMLDGFMSILSPPQMASLLQWVQRFGSVCVKINI